MEVFYSARVTDVRLSRNSIATRVIQIAENLRNRLDEEISTVHVYSTSTDGSADILNITHSFLLVDSMLI
ncbi:hypothetical protein TNCV_129791 [Trichonephila clavipes]|nr:hypothetical protein TNCV_129791 [Trichonephila clavipes]